MQIETDKIWYQQLPLLYLISRVQWEVSDRERDFKFCHPQIACGDLTSFHSFLWLLTSKKFFGATCELSGFVFFTSVRCFSLICTWGQCLSFFFSSFFYKMLVVILLGMHASAYFIFGIFISIYFCHDLCHAIFGKCIYIYIYIVLYGCANMQEFKCRK